MLFKKMHVVVINKFYPNIATLIYVYIPMISRKPRHWCLSLLPFIFFYIRARVNVPGFGNFNITYTGLPGCDCEQNMVSML